MIERTFHPIGQGAFYTEQFDDGKFTMVYDCGSYEDIDKINDAIKHSGLRSDIDLLVISHFHQDHINGLEYLLKNYNVKNILLPFLHPIEKIELFLYNSNPFIKNFCLNTESAVSEISKTDTSIVYVSDRDSEEYEDIKKDIDSLKNYKVIKNGTNITISSKIKNSKWIYVPFNFRYENRSKQLKELFCCKGIPYDDMEEFLKYYESNKDEVISTYKKVTGDMNTNSLVLYSGLKKDKENDSKLYSDLLCCQSHSVGCLYLGDYNAKGLQKWKQLQNAFKDYFDYVGTIQIPHHGSRHNYNDKLNFRDNLFSVISSGDRFNHPHNSVVEQIDSKKGVLKNVTDDFDSVHIESLYLKYSKTELPHCVKKYIYANNRPKIEEYKSNLINNIKKSNSKIDKFKDFSKLQILKSSCDKKGIKLNLKKIVYESV